MVVKQLKKKNDTCSENLSIWCMQTVVWLLREFDKRLESQDDILSNKLNMYPAGAKFLLVCLQLSEQANNDDTFMQRMIAGNVSWAYDCDVERKDQSSQWVGKESPRQGNTHSFNVVGYFKHNWKYNKGVLQQLTKKQTQKEIKVVIRQLSFVTSPVYCQSSDDCSSPASLHPRIGFLYFFFLFPKLKSVMKGCLFDTIYDIKK